MSPSFSTSVSSIIHLVQNWWLGEKYDGVRVCWNPDDKILLGNQIYIPSSFIDKMPSVFLDSEIWFGRGNFSETAAIYSRDPLSNFSFLKVVAFDKPDTETQKRKFEKRYAFLLSSLDPFHPFTIIAMRFLSKSEKILTNTLEAIMNDGGEGIILRKQNSFYIRGRSDLLWKLKTQREDTEALVVRAEDNNTFLLQLPNGSTFYAPLPKEATTQPKKGDVVTFFYDNFTQHSLPSNPSIFRVRSDLNWDDVLQQHSQNGESTNSTYSTKPRGYWANEKTTETERDNEKDQDSGREKRERKEKGKANMRNFLESFARSNHHDPLLAETWYLLADNLRKQKEMRAIVSEYGSYIKGLQNIFPELQFHDFQFSSLPKNYWTDVRNRHKYLLEFASKRNFDPLLSSSWYSLSLDDILREKEIASIIPYYNYNFGKALLHLFPNIGLEKDKLTNLSGNPYNIKYQKQIFINYAKLKGFDPLLADNWYTESFQAMRELVDTRFIERIYQGKFATAVMTFFPTIGVSKEKFHKKVKSISLENQKEFFDKYAEEHGFDSQITDNWYSVELQSILSTKNGYTILTLYNKSLANALARVYPHLNFVHSFFGKRMKEHQAAFNDFANSQNFDPLSPSHWYSISKRLLLSHQGVKKIMGYYRDDVVKALTTVYPNIGLRVQNFGSRKKQHWSYPAVRREFFDSLSLSLSLDPLNPVHWYSNYSRFQSLVSSHKDGVNILKYHNMSVSQAIADLYPNIGLKRENLK